MGIVKVGAKLALHLGANRPFYYAFNYLIYSITALVVFPSICLLCTQGAYELSSRETPVDNAVIDMSVLMR